MIVHSRTLSHQEFRKGLVVKTCLKSGEVDPIHYFFTVKDANPRYKQLYVIYVFVFNRVIVAHSNYLLFPLFTRGVIVIYKVTRIKNNNLIQ